MKTRWLPYLLLLLVSGTPSLYGQSPVPDDAFFLDWGKRFNQAWMRPDTIALHELLSDDMLITLSWSGGIIEHTKTSFISESLRDISFEFQGLVSGKTTPYFYSKDSLAVRRSKDGNTVWLLQNYFHKDKWKQSTQMMQDSGIITMQTTFQSNSGKWRPVASFINNITLKKTNPWGCLSHAVDVSTLEGKRIRLQAAVKTAVEGSGSASLWARIDKKNEEVGFFDNMSDRSISSKEWAIYKIEGMVDIGADSLHFGGCLTTPGTAWFDDFQLEVEESAGKWMPVALNNGGFEAAGDIGKRPIAWLGNVFRFSNFTTSFSTDAPFRGKQSFEISGKPE